MNRNHPIYNLQVDPRGYFDGLAATEDSGNVLTVEKDYAAPGKPGYVVRNHDGQRVLSTMRWGFPTRKPRKRDRVPPSGVASAA